MRITHGSYIAGQLTSARDGTHGASCGRIGAMSGLRFSIANLLTAVAIIGAGLAALNSPSAYSASLLTFATMVVLLVAVLGAIYRTGETQAFWLGVALFGGSYFVVAFSPAFSLAENQIREPLKAFRRAFWSSPLPPSVTTIPADKEPDYTDSTMTHFVSPAWDRGFGAKLHCLVNLLLALAGGVIGRWFHATSLRTSNAAQHQ